MPWRLPSIAVLLLGVAPSHAQVVVLAHPESGDFIVVHNRPQPTVEAMRRAIAKQPSGWKPLLGSTVAGHGAMFCFSPTGGETRYFLTEGRTTAAEAVKDARSRANTAASVSRSTTFSCGSWNNRNVYPLDARSSLPANPTVMTEPSSSRGVEGAIKENERGLLDTTPQHLRKWMTCEPEKNNCRAPPKSTGSGVRG